MWRDILLAWLVGVYIPADRFSGELDRLRTMAIMGAGVLAAALLFTAALGRRISQPITAIGTTTIAPSMT